MTLAAELRERGIGLHVIEEGIDTDTTVGRTMSRMLSALAEPRHELIVANTMDGLATARAAAGSPVNSHRGDPAG